ncbi:MAG: DUF4234 domain-containing protein [Spirochaetes bacterium]|jgi:hypothetical protein|nr:DUF4234 domain-containing protein [Spirochaetota bacterium]
MKGEIRNPAAVIIFSIITCGIYALVWIYKFSREIKDYLGREDLNPGTDLILSMICFPYLIYWSYKYGLLIMDAQKKAGKQPSDDTVLYLIVAIFGLFIVDMAIMQSKMNEIWEQQ